MRKKTFIVLFIIFFIVLSIVILNLNVTTRQGINYKVSTLKIPLYLKILDFYDRHFNYKWLVSRITTSDMSDYDRIMDIFNWTVDNLVRQPKELRTVDDHVWHIIVRGYGACDQFADVFSTLCNYAGYDAFFMKLSDKTCGLGAPFAFVNVKSKWYVFDPYNGAYFLRNDKRLASIEDIAAGNWWVYTKLSKSVISKGEYGHYFSNIASIDFKGAHKWSRANMQSPVNRFFYGIFKRVNYGSHN